MARKPSPLPLGERAPRAEGAWAGQGEGVVPAHPTELTRREVTLTMAGVLVVMFLAALDQTIVGTAMPRIVADLQGFEHYAWITTAYMLTSTAVVPIVGKLSDLYGRKRFYLLGLVVFLVGSAVCGAANGMTELVLFRGLQGIGGGIVQAIAFIVIGDLFPPARRGRLQGMFAGVFGLAAVIGPPLGGYLTENLSWRWVFYVNLPLGLVILLGIARYFPHVHVARPHGGIDFAGAFTLVAGIVPLLLALSWGGRDYAWGSPEILALLAVSGVMLVALVWIERRAAEPIIPPALFRQRTISLAITASFMISVGMFGTIVFFPLYLQAVLGASPTVSGRVFLPMMGGMIIASGVSGWLISRIGRYRPFAIGGPAVMTVGLLLVSRLGEGASLTAAGAALFVVGLGLGTVFPVYTIVVQNAASAEMLGVATSSAQFFRQIGGTLGSALLGAYLIGRYNALAGGGAASVIALGGPEGLSGLDRAALSSSLDEIFLIGAAAVAVAFVASALLPEVPLRRGRFARPTPAADTAGGRVAVA